MVDGPGGRDGRAGAFATDAVFGWHQLSVRLPDGREITREVRWERAGRIGSKSACDRGRIERGARVLRTGRVVGAWRSLR